MRHPLLIALSLALLAGCGTDTTLVLTTEGLPPTGPYTYAAWLDDGAGATELLGTFVEQGEQSFTVASLDGWTEVFVTMELGEPTVPGPTEVLRGPLDADGADLELPFDVDVAGGVSLWSPTDNDTAPDNPEQGAWFIERVNDQNTPGLLMDPPADGWVYTGWAATQGVFLPMGSFSEPEGSDSDCFFCGPSVEFPHPGEDFVADLPDDVGAAVNLADGLSSITLSLSPGAYDLSPGAYDLSPGAYDLDAGGPFRLGLDVLSVTVPLDQGGGELVDMDGVFDAPSGGLLVQ